MVKSREISEELNLPNGGYVLIVSSQQAAILGKFMIRILVESAGEEIQFLDEKIKERKNDNHQINQKELELLNKM